MRPVPRLLPVLLLLAVAFSGCAGAGSNANLPPEVIEEDGQPYVKGIVVDAELVPIAAASIKATVGDVTASGVSDEGGAFKIGPLSAGSAKIVAEKSGYAATEVTLALPQEVEAITLVLDALSRAVPYHETFTYAGYYDCMIAARYPSGNPTWPCIGIIDLATGTTISRDTWIHPFEITNPGFVSVLMEMTWQAQSTGQWMGVQIRDASGYDETGAQSYFWHQSLPNLRAWAYAGQENPGGDAAFYPEPNVTAKYAFTTSSASNPEGEVDFQFWIAHRSTLYATFFYNRAGPEDFAVVPDA